MHWLHIGSSKLSAQRVIRLDLAGNKVWRVGEAEVQEVGVQELICIKPNNQSLVGLIFQHSPNVPRGLKIAEGLKSLTCSDGLRKLMTIRNNWVEERSAPEQAGCTLFDPEPSDSVKVKTQEQIEKAEPA